MENLDRTRLIEAYYRGTLKGIDKTHFKQLMDEDPDFKQEVKDFKAIFKGLEALHIDQFQSRLMNMEAKYQTKTGGTEAPIAKDTNNIRPLKKFYSYAAAVALLVCASYAYYFVNSDPFDQYFQASSSIAVHIGSIRSSDAMPVSEQMKKNAFSAYQQKDYKTCIQLLSDYTNQYPNLAVDDYQAALVLGVAQLASESVDAAIKNFEFVMQSRESSYRQEAEWMWSLAQIKLEKADKAKPVLEKIIAQKGHIHQKEAKEIILNF